EGAVASDVLRSKVALTGQRRIGTGFAFVGHECRHVAQWESASLTRKRPAVQSRPCLVTRRRARAPASRFWGPAQCSALRARALPMPPGPVGHDARFRARPPESHLAARMSEITVTFEDGASERFPAGTTAREALVAHARNGAGNRKQVER